MLPLSSDVEFKHGALLLHHLGAVDIALVLLTYWNKAIFLNENPKDLLMPKIGNDLFLV